MTLVRTSATSGRSVKQGTADNAALPQRPGASL